MESVNDRKAAIADVPIYIGREYHQMDAIPTGEGGPECYDASEAQSNRR